MNIKSFIKTVTAIEFKNKCNFFYFELCSKKVSFTKGENLIKK